MASTATTVTYNHDVAGLQRRLNRFIVEMVKSVSNSGSMMNAWDQGRLETYLAAIRAYVAWIVGQPFLDLPETSPRMITLDANPDFGIIENESIIDVVRLLEIARDEIVNSQSSRQSSGLISFDESRVLGVISKIEAFVADYIKTVTPLDLPESSPMRDMSGPGRTGI